MSRLPLWKANSASTVWRGNPAPDTLTQFRLMAQVTEGLKEGVRDP